MLFRSNDTATTEIYTTEHTLSLHVALPIYRPTREVSTLETTPYYAREVRYRAEVEPTFERFVYRPLTRGVLRLAQRMRVIQAGSLHAYLGYVMALVLFLVVLLWWRG